MLYKKEISFYIIATLLILSIVILVMQDPKFNAEEDPKVEISGVEIPSSQLNNIAHELPDGLINVCEIDTGKCGIILKTKIE